MFSIAICAARAHTSLHLLEQSRALLQQRDIPCTIDTFPAIDDLFALLAKHPQRYNLLFLEVSDNLDAAERLRSTHRNIALVLIADSAQWAVDGYRVGALRYLLTPVCTRHLADVYDTLKEHRKHRRLQVGGPGNLEFLSHSDILYLQSWKRVTQAVLPDRTVACSERLSELCKRLPREQFVHTHQSYVVNLQQVRALQKTTVVLQDGRNIPVSRRLHACVRQSLIQFQSELAP